MTEYLPDDNRAYKEKSYWDSRFYSEDSYDWLARYENLAELLTKYVRPSDRILMVGCGNSTFSIEMYNAGFHNITNIDFSGIVIARMKAKYKDKMPEMKWKEADMTKLSETFKFGSFDVVIDKAAMDALMCDEGDVWSPSETVIKEAAAMCSGIASVLVPEGIFLQISFAQPHFRKRFLLGEGETPPTSTIYGWDFSYHNIEIGLGYFFYVLKKTLP
ncbi:s-adenosyl-l-methionine-dependent methyltransferase [Plasmopara halstedii]|uniref:S-adenosyl-l-methionine-dependent methyltransferase n=1 Tax=Plasmopara halstedii TaxID=4781 RepID=A0A0P1ABL8_PLAHL|nr:s-adenosyl-l-methionine-dependent methyltransferase [Plasmopara halstedii]CEG38239.1 s-adenosyl-l-methionine-dependent methyltransferase [Plasmopara halstedii]|eukprot:XP_024574608.1 s-adenosyl-l-methionine-dependent methyltransferase [Plasmopara halstedii]